MQFTHMQNMLVLLSMTAVVTKLVGLEPEDEIHVLALATLVSQATRIQVEDVLDTWANFNPELKESMKRAVKIQKDRWAKERAGAMASVGIEA